VRRRDFLGALAGGMLGAGGLARAAAAADLAPRRRAGDLRFVERWSWAMGQPVHLQLYAESEDAGYAAAQAALAELRRVEGKLSLYDDRSDLSELNRHAGRGPMRVDADLAAVLAAAVRLHRVSGGAFDPAVEPLMRAWGFHARRTSEPSEVEIAEAREAVRTARIELGADRVALPSAHTRLDLGGIGVGYGLDRAVEMLRREGIQHALLDVSGDCFALGRPPGEPGWLVEVADPQHQGRTIAATRLRDGALATSSNLVSVLRYGRAVRGHVMDPATGWPAKRLAQVSVVARSGIEADALSTAMLVSRVRPEAGVTVLSAES
jgi:thiamine biosynthesis lipoprotein